MLPPSSTDWSLLVCSEGRQAAASLGGERVDDSGIGRVTTINFNGLFATQAQVAQALQQTSQALQGTGFEVSP